MGKGADGLMRGSEVLYQDLDELKEVAEALLEDNEFSEKLPDDAFVFFMHQGYQFDFFCTSEGDDPPVYRFLEGEDTKSFPVIYPHFTGFVIGELRFHAYTLEEVKKLRAEREAREAEQAKKTNQ
jgi:hypothetical protein